MGSHLQLAFKTESTPFGLVFMFLSYFYFVWLIMFFFVVFFGLNFDLLKNPTSGLSEKLAKITYK